MAFAPHRTHARLAAATALAIPALAFSASQAWAVSAPTVIGSGTAVSDSVTGEDISGQINPNGETTYARIDYKTGSGALTASKFVALGKGTSPVSFSIQLTGLTAGATYSYHVVAASLDYNDVDGPSQTFVAPTPPSVIGSGTAVADAVSGEDITGTVNPNGVTTYGRIDLGSTPTSLSAAGSFSKLGSGTSNVTFTTRLTGLTAGATYYYRVVGTTVDNGETYGPVQSFVAPTPPSVITSYAPTADAVSGTEDFTALLNPNGHQAWGRVDIGLSPTTLTGTGIKSIGSGTVPVTYGGKATGLTPGKTYYYRLVATTLDNGETYGPTLTFVAH